ncbi:MAG: DUF3458 domain-containing protein [Planctomycetaceae bacterium]|nr:DUF3458 domain-containing protein [Planctomycetaceae bacterium]
MIRHLRTVPAFLFLFLLTGGAVAAEAKRGPFTAGERSLRSRDVDQRHVRLDLSIDWDKQQIDGRAALTLKPFSPISRVTLDAAEIKVLKVELLADGSQAGPLKFTHRDSRLEVELGREIAADQEFRLAIEYRIVEPKQGAHFVLPDEREPNQARMVWTQSEPEYARYWFPCHDHPSDRFTSEILATVPQDYLVLSNGVLKEKKPAGDGKMTWHFVQEPEHVSYLMSIVAGEFEAYEQSWDGLPITSYVPKGRLDQAERSFDKTARMVEYYSQLLDYRYPWAKYAQICVDEYGWGGMEHTSATTLNLNTLHDERAQLDTTSEDLVAHELVHQWFGDLITCKDWSHIWLNESFATFFTTVWFEHEYGADEAAWRRAEEAESYKKEDKDRYRRPLVTSQYEKPLHMFDRHSYPKGARVLHMLRFVLGEEAFWRTIRYYTKKHAFQSIETAQFRIALEEATGQGLDWFFDQWIYHGGHPQYDVSYTWDSQQKQVVLVVKQTQTVDDLTPLFRMPVEIALVTSKGEQIRKITVAKAEETFRFDLEERPGRVCFDPNDWILKDVSFHKDKVEWIDQAQHGEHLMSRIQAVGEMGGMKGDHDARNALIELAKSDGFWALRQEAVKALAGFSGDEVRNCLIAVAGDDAKSFVRREAVKSLGKFAHDDTRAALRAVVKKDASYETAAEALRSLAKVDRAGCRDDFVAALGSESHRQVILKAAADGLAEIENAEAIERLLGFLKAPTTPDRRIAVLEALARLGGNDDKVLEAVCAEMDDCRWSVRQAAYEALAGSTNVRALGSLSEQRARETNPRLVLVIDESLEKIRQRQTDVARLRSQVESLSKQAKSLETRIKKLEDGNSTPAKK